MTEPLKSDDGLFLTTAESAVDVAYMVSCMEGYLCSVDDGGRTLDHHDTRRWLGELLVDYLEGEKSCEEIRQLISDEAAADQAELDRKIEAAEKARKAAAGE